VEFPNKVSLVVVQVNWLGLAMLILGTPTAALMVSAAVEVHPLAMSVAVTVYTPALVTVAGLAALLKLGPFQSMVLPGLVPVKVTLALVQVIAPLLTADTVGTVVLLVMVTAAVPVQPFTGSVAVTV
jgi:hypothetical protein